MATGKMPLTSFNLITTTMHFLSMWHQGGGAKRFSQGFPGGNPRFRFVDHHLAHALSAYSYSGFDEAAVVIIDGRGAWEATSIWHGRGGQLEHVLTINWPDSLGFFYAVFTEYLGFVPFSDEWKVMGLAPYGQPGVDLRFFIDAEADPYRVTPNISSATAPGFLRSSRVLACPAPPNPKSTTATKTSHSPCRMLANPP